MSPSSPFPSPPPPPPPHSSEPVSSLFPSAQDCSSNPAARLGPDSTTHAHQSLGSNGRQKKPRDLLFINGRKKKAPMKASATTSSPSTTTASSSCSSNHPALQRPPSRLTKKPRLHNMAGAENTLLSMLREDEEQFTLVVNAVWDQVQEDMHPRVPRRLMNTSEHTGEMWVNELLSGHEQPCYNMCRVHPSMFLRLVDVLVSRSLIKDSRYVSAKQQLAMFLYAAGHGAPTGVLMEHFQHSSQTVSYYVNKVAFALATLKDEYIIQPNQVNECHPYVANNDRFYPYFKDAIGAIDGTHIPANVDIEDQPRFRNRKQVITQNVMGVVSFDGLFQYACVGWEGSAPDMRVLRWAISHGGFFVPNGKYYLVDAGYGNSASFLAPYRGQRYHISTFRRRGNNPYENKKEKFNHRHAQLRNCVERAFGVLKMRFQTLREGNMYPFTTQKKIVWACLVVHNFIRREQGYDYYFNQPVEINPADDVFANEEVLVGLGPEATATGEALREQIANELWAVGNA